VSEFNIKRTVLGPGSIRLDVCGYLDAHTFERMQQVIDECFRDKIYKLIVNLEEVDYISSAGAGVFIGAIGTAQENGGNIVLLNPTENVKEVFDLLGLSLIFTFAATEEEAIGVMT
jgi:anti-sigma B factor antagonist